MATTESSSAWSSLTTFVIDTAEKIVNEVEEGTSILFGWDTETPSSSRGSSGFAQKEDPSGEYDDLDDESFNPLNGIADGVIGDIMSAQSGPQTFRENVDAFKSAITWKEPFIIALVAFQVFMMLLAAFAIRRKSFELRVAIFLVIFLLVRGSEYANDYLRVHYEEYGITQNYFDTGGVFTSIMLCGPLLIICICLLFSFLWEAKTLLVQVKRMDLQKKARQQEKQNKKEKVAAGASAKKSNANARKKKPVKED
eukprot:CAMPEP_0195518666 /NCGR_PEP_ID=MMETSP0794_2-20130614/13455_1 /TAXON_ID=515487 /ORGANISM="Stephanopyxis turris, Strain CCMP 815" /LENGTH=253 /DNA_ID=CAMNT_0040647683 /DNA_START=151 /DNA_END=912 /DNA_ORIENTATION=+